MIEEHERVITDWRRVFPALAIITGLFLTSCSTHDDGRFKTFAEGTLEIAGQPDSTRDFSGFEVLLANQLDGDIDTLAIATTDMDGFFRLDISAVTGGIYPLIVRRAGVHLSTDQFVIAEGDTAVISGTYPLNGKRLRIISRENSAWMAYLNTKAQHNASMLRMLEAGDSAKQSIPQIAEQTAAILWSLRSLYSGTFGADLASVESIQMLEGWNDPLAVDRIQELRLDNQHIVDAVRSARRSEARIAGLDASIALISYYIQELDDVKAVAALTAELVIAYSDSLRSEEALEAALSLRRGFPDSEWARWASRAAYELENLLPGMPAPPFSVKTRDGGTFALDDANGRYFVLEFYEPLNKAFRQELAERDAVFAAMNPLMFLTLSVSVETDDDINEALFEEGDHAGLFAFAGSNESEIASVYNIHVLPTRFLIDPDGIIVAKYSGLGLRPLEKDLVALVQGVLVNLSTND